MLTNILSPCWTCIKMGQFLYYVNLACLVLHHLLREHRTLSLWWDFPNKLLKYTRDTAPIGQANARLTGHEFPELYYTEIDIIKGDLTSRLSLSTEFLCMYTSKQCVHPHCGRLPPTRASDTKWSQTWCPCPARCQMVHFHCPTTLPRLAVS